VVLQDRMDTLSLYTASVAHDIGTPLAAFSMGLQLLASAKLNEEQRQIVQDLQAAEEMMSVVTRKALDHQKCVKGQDLMPSMKPTNIRELVSKCSSVLRNMSSMNSSVELSFHVAEDVSEMVLTDGTWIWDCMVNFMSNACKFTTEGTVILSVTQSEGKLWLTVTDTGRGIPEECLGQLFKPFIQLQTDAGGTGLGLASIAMQASALGGSYGVSQNKPKGSRFWISVPYIPSKSLSATSSKPALGAASDMQGLSVLLIEDTKAVRCLTTKLLQKVGMVVHEAENGTEGLAKMQEREFEIVLCDMMMPVMSGLECIDQFRCWEAAHRPDRHQTICLLTAQATEDIKELALGGRRHGGIDHVWEKPVRIPKVVEIIRSSDRS